VTGLTGTASVIDGDTIEIHGTRIRLEGIEAPESRQTCFRDGRNERCSQQSSFHLSNQIGRKTVRCSDEGRDRYGRTLAICYLGSQDLNAMMVRDGHAVAYRRYSRRYVGEENEARKARRGIWSAEFQMPWDWRRAR
jgi:endonuclease YncB( thermonuclease family)